MIASFGDAIAEADNLGLGLLCRSIRREEEKKATEKEGEKLHHDSRSSLMRGKMRSEITPSLPKIQLQE